jgi:hypothetical protein
MGADVAKPAVVMKNLHPAGWTIHGIADWHNQGGDMPIGSMAGWPVPPLLHDLLSVLERQCDE